MKWAIGMEAVAEARLATPSSQRLCDHRALARIGTRRADAHNAPSLCSRGISPFSFAMPAWGGCRAAATCSTLASSPHTMTWRPLRLL